MNRIAHIITGLKRGGSETTLFRLLTHLPEFEHHVFSLTDLGAIGPELVQAGIKVSEMHFSYGSPGLYRLSSALKEFQPDLVQTWMYHGDCFGGLAAYFSGYRNIFWNVRNSTLDLHLTKAATRTIARLCGLLSKTIPQKIVTCSYEAQKVHEKLGYEASKFMVIPNGVDCDLFKPNPEWRKKIRADLKIPHGVPLVGMVARCDPQKDYATFLEAARYVSLHSPEARFVIAGPGCSAMQSKIQQEHLQDRLILLGDRKDVPQLLNALDIFVLSSAYGEAFPNVVAEAMACGVPCVATRVGDTAEIIGNTGIVVEPREPEALAQGCLQLLKSGPPEDPRQRILSLFSLDRMITRYRALYLKAISLYKAA